MNEKEDRDDFKIPEEVLKKINSQSELDDFFSDLYKKALYLAVNKIQQK